MQIHFHPPYLSTFHTNFQLLPPSTPPPHHQRLPNWMRNCQMSLHFPIPPLTHVPSNLQFPKHSRYPPKDSNHSVILWLKFNSKSPHCSPPFPLSRTLKKHRNWRSYSKPWKPPPRSNRSPAPSWVSFISKLMCRCLEVIRDVDVRSRTNWITSNSRCWCSSSTAAVTCPQHRRIITCTSTRLHARLFSAHDIIQSLAFPIPTQLFAHSNLPDDPESHAVAIIFPLLTSTDLRYSVWPPTAAAFSIATTAVSPP